MEKLVAGRIFLGTLTYKKLANVFKVLASYYFSKYPSVWGWATWKEKWAKYDLNMRQWAELKHSKWLDDVLQTSKAVAYWNRMFNHMKNGLDTWDYALAYSCWLHNGLSIRSRVNMISNVGFGKDATHTHQTEMADNYANPMDIEFPLKHPTAISIDKEIDDRIEWVSFSGMDERRLQVVRESIYKSRSHEGS